MPVFNNILAGAAGQAGGAAAAGPIKSVRFNNDDSAYLNRTPSSSGNRKTWTWAAWFKPSNIGGTGSTGGHSLFSVRTGSGDSGLTDFIYNTDGTLLLTGASTTFKITTAKFRDFSAWYHIVLQLDTTQATAADRIKIYVNGSRITEFSTNNNPAQNADLAINNTTLHKIGGYSNVYLDGYLADVYFIDGQALDPTSFGAFDDNGVWQAAAYSGTFGTNGFHLFDFANESTLGHDSSGNENDFTANNFSTSGTGTDIMVDVPTNGTQSDTGAGGEVSGNYCTWNPLTKGTYSNGNLESSNNIAQIGTGTIGVSSGKFYWEVTCTSSSSFLCVGITPSAYLTENYPGASSTSGHSIYFQSGAILPSGSSYGAFSNGDVLNVKLDLDNGDLYFGKNGTYFNSGNAIVTGLTGTWFPAIGSASGVHTATTNFGQRAFAYSAPSGYKALCTANLPTSDVPDGSDYFDVATWAGNSSTQSITGLGFQPDFLWYKSLSAYHYGVQDAVRGVGKSLSPSRIDVAEQTETTGLDAFTSDGFDLDGDGFYYINKSGQNFVGWAWNGGGSTVSNTDGTLTSSVRASQTAGTSIVTYTGSGSATSVGHGLNATPDAIIVKNRDTTSLNWAVYHSGLPANESVALNLAWGYTSIADHFDAPSSTVFNIASDDTVNKSGDDFVAYCFSSVEGFSKFGTYVGTGASGSPFVYLGFKPALLIIKKQSSGNWFIHDYKRPGYNQNTGPLRIAAEAELTVTTYDLDILSNGFVMRTTGGDANGSGSDYIYFAWAENPFQNNGGLAR